MAEKTELETIGGRIKDARVRNGWTQKQVSEWSGISPGHIAQFEMGTRKPAADNIVKLSKGLRVTSDWLLGMSAAR